MRWPEGRSASGNLAGYEDSKSRASEWDVRSGDVFVLSNGRWLSKCVFGCQPSSSGEETAGGQRQARADRASTEGMPFCGKRKTGAKE